MTGDDDAGAFFRTLPQATAEASAGRRLLTAVGIGLGALGAVVLATLFAFDGEWVMAASMAVYLGFFLMMWSWGEAQRRLEAARRHFEALHPDA